MLQPIASRWDHRPGLEVLIEERLGELLSSAAGEAAGADLVGEAARHSLLAGGKRLRPRLLLLATETLGGDLEGALDPACAVEMVHTASLVFDDLPCMDDSELRRGRPTCHAAYGEPVATLAGISLLTRAFSVLSSARGLGAGTRSALVRTLSLAVADAGGMVAGQVRDLESAEASADLTDVESLASQKTAVLFVCAARMGARVAGADGLSVEAVGRFAHKFGLCFQVLDDLADLESSSGCLGKDVRKDLGKATFATLLGPVEGRRLAHRLAQEALLELESVGLSESRLAETVREAYDSSIGGLAGSA